MRSNAVSRRNLLAAFLAFVFVTAIAIAPVFFEVEAIRQAVPKDGRTESHDPDHPDYDIRGDKKSVPKLAEMRSRVGRTAAEVADIRDRFVRAEQRLRGNVPSLKIEYNDDLRVPEVIGPDVRQGREFLTPPASGRRPDVLRGFLRANAELTGVAEHQVGRLKVAADYKNPENDLSFVHLEQAIDGIPVFRGEVKAGFTKNGEIVRVINNLAPDIDETIVSRHFGNPVDALASGARHIGRDVRQDELFNASESTANKIVFGSGDWATTAEKIYFPTEPGVVVPGWRFLFWEPINAFYVIVDAKDGTLLWRKNITDDQTQAASFNVWTNPNAMINVADSPFPMTPGPSSPNGAQGSFIARTMVTRVGNEAPYNFNNAGWINDGVNITDGNAVQAGLDRDATQGVDTNGVPSGNSRVFDFPINPAVPVASGNTPAGDSPLSIFTFAPGSIDIATNKIARPQHGLANNARVRISSSDQLPAPLSQTTSYFVVTATADDFALSTTSGGAPVDITSQGAGTLTLSWAPTPCVTAGTAPPMTDYQRAIVTQLFYITNWYHDETYRLGFTEAARNFQNDNFGRGGTGNDRVSAEAQDCAGTNNANFSSPSDGGRGRMQMFLWSNPMVDVDGSLDADVVIHELTHGLSNRLHGNSSGLGGLNMSRAMGEGWSDFYAHAMLSEPTDPINGIYTTGGYATYQLRAAPNQFNNYYYGIRRFPKAVMAFTGPNGRPHNPLTFDDIDVTKANLSDGAFAPAFTGTADQVHAAGEVWSSALWEVRAKYIEDLGWEVGNRRVLQHVTDGMKLAPLTPTFLQERDAIIAGALASGTAQDVANLWEGFAIRGMGAGASIQNSGGSTADGSGTGQTRVTQAFDLPNLMQEPAITVSDLLGNNNGFAEPGEPLRITVPLKNITGNLASDVTVQIVGGGSAFYGSIAHNGTASNIVSYTVPAATPCGSSLTLTINVTSSLGPVSFQRTIQIGQPSATFSENFDGVTAPAIPANWTVAAVQNGTPFVTTTNNANSSPNAIYALDPTTVGGGTNLTSPSIPVTIAAAVLSFRNRYDTENGWDGGVLEISINGGAFQDIITAGGSFIENGYNGTLGANGTNNPLNGRSAWTGNSNGYLTTKVRLPAAAAGQNVQLRFRFGADDNTTGAGPNPGWYIDNIEVAGNAACAFAPTGGARADFDGDGRTDVSVFRPSENNWYVNKSNGGVDVVNWGLSGDRIVPGNYDGDAKADIAVFRPSENRWYIINSNGFSVTQADWGLTGDVTVPADYDDDGKTDVAVFRPSENNWYVRRSSGGIQVTNFGLAGDVPVPGDYDGDGAADIAIYRTGQWWIALSTGGLTVRDWGLPGDHAVPADYDGDNKDDIAVWRPGDGKWYITRSLDGAVDVRDWGLNGDVPVPGDYDGDGADDPAVYRNGTWYIARSQSGIFVIDWGLNGDRPIPAAYIP